LSIAISQKLSHAVIVYLDKPSGPSEEGVKRKSVQISDGRQLIKEGGETQPAVSRWKRGVKRGSSANVDFGETQSTKWQGKRRRVSSRRSYADYDYDDHAVHACDECDKSYPTYHGLLIHKGRNHKQVIPESEKLPEKPESTRESDGELQAEDSDLFVCEDCKKTFDTYHGFLIHAGRYHKSVVDVFFPNVAESGDAEKRTSDPKVRIENGSEAVEIDISTFSCDGCDKSFHSEHGLLIHTGRAHRWRTPIRKKRRKSTKKIAHAVGPSDVVDLDDEPSNENGEIAIVTSAAASMEGNETSEVNERTPTDADPVQNNDMAEANE
uniref:C2H2-type domain-containing protein n=1 Tax=Rodentolepis nana TaxID=102285 RepID=A0A0R3TVF6_RODNA